MNRTIGPVPVRGSVALLVLVAMIALVALPVLAADPSSEPSADASASAEATDSTEATPSPAPTSSPESSPTTEAPTPTAAPTTGGSGGASPDERDVPTPDNRAKPGKPDKAEKGPEIAITVTGTVGSTTNGKGWTVYTLTAGSTVRGLSAGPPWFYGDDNPLKPFVGKTVTVVGTTRAGDDDIDVASVDGTAIREPGRPPWAGGWKVVGESHPGWSQEKWDRWQAKAADQAAKHGTDCWPPGHCKDKSQDTDEPDGD